jgi:putative NADH-flavin reductase
MKLLVLGATGPTGRHLVDQALRCGDSVTALVRNPIALGDLAERLTVVPGDATSRADLTTAAAGQDAIVSALGRSTSLRAERLFTRSSSALIDAAREVRVPRLVWLSSFGVGETFYQASILQKLIYATLLRSIYSDKNASEHMIRVSGLDWTIVYPTRLTHSPELGRYQAADRLLMKGNPTISRADVASFMHDAVHSDDWVNRSPVITD